MTQPEFEHLLSLARGGCRSALGQLLSACRNYLLAVAQADLPAALAAKVAPSSAVQDTFLDAGRDLAGFRGDRFAEFQSWLRAILMNNLGDARRRFCGAEMRELTRERPLSPGSLASTDPTPSAQASEAEQVRRLQDALARLPDDYRQVIEWRNRDKFRFAEIGARLGRSADAARMLWNRAVGELQDVLADR